MNGRGRRGEPTGSGAATPTGPVRKARKKPKSPESEQRIGPIPAPYLALAPSPVSSLSQSDIDQLSSQLVLPSSYLRGGTPSSQPLTSSSTPNLHSGPSRQRKRQGGAGAAGATGAGTRGGYAAGLLAPPTILPGGTASTPRVQPLPAGTSPSLLPVQAPQYPRRRSADRSRALLSQRSEERLREVTILNASLSSLGQLGQILETGRMPEEPDEAVGEAETQALPASGPARRRRRIVRGEGGGGLARRPTVSSREEGRALGLARGASMRRTNVWDNIPEAGEPPPPFPFPTPSSSRLPPTFSAAPMQRNRTQRSSSGASMTSTRSLLNPTLTRRPHSPPPSFEIALGLIHPSPDHNIPQNRSPSPEAEATTPRARPTLSLSITAPGPLSGPELAQPNSTTASSNASPTSTHYASAPSSPSQTILSVDDALHLTEDERADRKMWNADLLAGYTLEERVHRELARRKAREQAVQLAKADGPALASATPSSATTPTPGGESETPRISPPIPSGYAAGTCEVQEPNPGTGLGLEMTSHGAIESTSPSVALPRMSTEVEDAPSTAALRSGTAGDSSNESDQLVGSGLSSGSTNPPAKPVDDERRDVTAGEPSEPETVVEEAQDPPLPETLLTPELFPPSRSVPGTSLPAEPIKSSPSESNARNDTIFTAETAESAQPTNISNEDVEASSSEDDQTAATAPSGSAPIATPRDAEQPISPGPLSKLTHGPAIRRRSSDLTTSPRSPRSFFAPNFDNKRRSEGDIAPVVQPLFAGTGYRVGRLSPSPEGASTGKMEDPSPVPGPMDEKGADKASLPSSSTSSTQLPPNREAALRRRLELLPRSTPAAAALTPPSSTKTNRRSGVSPYRPLSGPLIDFNTDFSVPDFILPDLNIPLLSPSAAELLQLQDREVSMGGQGDETEPVAESSAQAAARAQAEAAMAAYQAGAEGRMEDAASIEATDGTFKRIPPPPPPSRAARRNTQTNSGRGDATPRAQSPHGHSTKSSELQAQGPPLPRRPAPPLPSKSSPTIRTAPPIPPRPPLSTIQQLFQSRSASGTNTGAAATAGRTESTSSMETVTPIRKATSPIQPLAKPRGPRPPPPRPRRTWSKVVQDFVSPKPLIEKPPIPALSPITPISPSSPVSRPFAERTYSENPRLRSPEGTNASEGDDERGVNRSASAVDLRNTSVASGGVGVGRREVEYTDLDLLVSRIEARGREFEDFTQITSFLGPSKTPSATPEALATLLPGLISVDSRRTTPQGKVKLKLSLLGVRVTKCPICLSQFKSGETGVLIPNCGHGAHEGCALRWFREDGRCFVCREVLGE